ncbi:hypothetical protein BLSTO_00227 [Blastocystis sp. subtype 1]
MSLNTFLHIPIVKDDTMRLVCVIINIFLAGVGTIIAGALEDTNLPVIICGVVQLLCGSFGLGFLWSWVWAYFIFTKKQVFN